MRVTRRNVSVTSVYYKEREILHVYSHLRTWRSVEKQVTETVRPAQRKDQHFWKFRFLT
jgi:hypothetical protein